MSEDFYPKLLEATAPARARLQGLPVVLDALQGRITLAEYQHFLRCAYHHVRHTVPLLMACGASLPERLQWLRPAIAEYIEEEIGHEAWIADDLAASGADQAALLALPLPQPVELMLAYVYDRIARHNPVSFFGMVLVLEGTSIALATRAAQALQQSLNLPKRAFRYLLSHGELDQSHMGFYEGLMNRLDCAEDRAAVIHAANMIYPLYGAVLADARMPVDVARAA